MAVQCSKCGEEVLGAANRCWKCGQPFSALPQGNLPPVRSAPVTLVKPIAAANAPPTTSITSSQAADAAEPIPAEKDDAVANEVAPTPSTTNSPSPSATAQPVAAPPVTVVPLAIPVQQQRAYGTTRTPSPNTIAQELREQYVAMAGFCGAIALGGFGILMAVLMAFGALSSTVFSILAVIAVAVLGFVMGVWGLYSKHRGWALCGMLLCSLAFALACFNGAMMWYHHILELRAIESAG